MLKLNPLRRTKAAKDAVNDFSFFSRVWVARDVAARAWLVAKDDSKVCWVYLFSFLDDGSEDNDA